MRVTPQRAGARCLVLPLTPRPSPLASACSFFLILAKQKYHLGGRMGH